MLIQAQSAWDVWNWSRLGRSCTNKYSTRILLEAEYLERHWLRFIEVVSLPVPKEAMIGNGTAICISEVFARAVHSGLHACTWIHTVMSVMSQWNSPIVNLLLAHQGACSFSWVSLPQDHPLHHCHPGNARSTEERRWLDNSLKYALGISSFHQTTPVNLCCPTPSAARWNCPGAMCNRQILGALGDHEPTLALVTSTHPFEELCTVLTQSTCCTLPNRLCMSSQTKALLASSC